MAESSLFTQNIVACLWDFDKTLIPGYMQTPLFQHFDIDEDLFWNEVNRLPQIYRERGQRVSGETAYLNHLLSFIRNGPLKGLTNQRLRELGAQLRFFPGMPELLADLKRQVRERAELRKCDITLEHYIVSTGLAEMIRGSAIAPHVDGIFGCEFVESPLPPFYSRQEEMPLQVDPEISQIGLMVDNTIKTRFVFEINKGSNRNEEIDVNAAIPQEDRRVPFNRMIYVADGPSDVPVFSVLKKGGGRTFAVYDPDSDEEFAQNDQLLRANRIHGYGPADYRPGTQTARWLKLQVSQICDNIVLERAEMLKRRMAHPPRHLRAERAIDPSTPASETAEQDELFREPEEGDRS